ncbi:Clp protease N-terminal domain-containing protein [Hymenobacter psychrotolerans]|uniref:ATP-dependent Clp protease ATP-binding subunit ClpC n=1 Tax=Hymenobacter psychrotolerans DSM 18569 TaxID=1121959 RepID=A0A1M7BV12_9BACT|nr:Clp protease N-terminal domain-containing protein [Hymenobacter psychrotolerans]SHL58706.1 ATP-dependent Clp protease ATP-binding subunit ClpC [Hymenobacter psychrotolerans DSM 18569]
MWPFAKRPPKPFLSENLKCLIAQSRETAIGLRNDFVGAEHLLLAILATPATPAAQVISRLLVSPALFAVCLQTHVAAHQIAPEAPEPAGSLPLTRELEHAFSSCGRVAREMGTLEVEALHLLPPLLALPHGAVAKLSAEFGLTFEVLLPLLRPLAARQT